MAKPPSPPKLHTSMRGVPINMEEMRARNEAAVAVTGRGANLRMNARGDTLAAGGRIDRKREDIDAAYNTQLQGNAKRVDVRAVEADTFETPAQVLERLKAAQAEPKPAKTNLEQKAPPIADVFESEVEADQPKNVAGKDRARRLSEKDD